MTSEDGIRVQRTGETRSRAAMTEAVHKAAGDYLREEPVEVADEVLATMVELIIQDHVVPPGSGDVDLTSRALHSYLDLATSRTVLAKEASATRRGQLGNLGWVEYLESLGASQSVIARDVGVSPGTVSRWMSGKLSPTLPLVIATAKAYKRSIPQAIVAAGFVTAEEARMPPVLPRALQLASVPTAVIMQELLRRELERTPG
ncbi:hypothetical protein GCM10025867_51610 (plasmid) [Frondihabitans sucicola]|uniref:HTH cro/C1-type domain-containing protein n=1 Tax=Frondihabitans sucicola TaxID=1268041 RepID=A0ABM8GV54_9MICO|nr:helix-turn-helix transcriptional regulator [Frondihabitans sucicola]BDZ52353.1 hypothetical protein GCM10025867_45940 [Frondihabitans sucicola]BDZ52920.1 hypothetical protein GCM10025867_51610 [Frondihabitans sucicola]